MKITLNMISVKDVFAGYKDNGENGVVGYGGMLDIRPAYQREFVYKEEQMKSVINTVLKGFPLNVMYWVDKEDGTYEVLDGQQRTLSIIKFLDHKYAIDIDGHSYYCDSLSDDKYNEIMDYELMIYICEGTASEKLDWFKTVNIAGEELTEQELRNSVHTGAWLTDAKKHFSKSGCAAYQLGSMYIKGTPIRQELLEKTLFGISNLQGTTIEQYMAHHQNDDDCDELWQYYQDVINWVNKTFITYHKKEMLTQNWFELYNEYYKQTFNATKLDKQIRDLMNDYDVTKKSGIYKYVLSGKEKYLSIREFDEPTKKAIYSEQKGICPMCGKHFELSEMHADHKTPWSKGGKTVKENCQMLCRDCNLAKSNK